MRQKQKTQLGQVGLDGAIAGLIATGPMTVFMLATQRLLPKGHQYALPPEIITGELASRMNVRPHLNKPELLGATLVSHLGYGAGMGMLYSPLSKIPLPSVIKGILFGVTVWAASYLVLLPMIGMSESGHREPGTRNLMMIAAHVVWGSVMGVVADMLIR
ncbi:MAG: DUF1440 domain-containing protein [Chloroflexi bacterium]|nr:hypothetical protein [Ktedonobacteraceae bacterium]MBV9021843.1 hypothetical protein [Ktedonobacteraceae bacterium]MBV9706074.1 DUF1440 domain-containing protein [Chloroflexota bacterium]